jgi:hypothetical protein
LNHARSILQPKRAEVAKHYLPEVWLGIVGRTILLALFLAATAVVWWWALSGDFGACLKGTTDEHLQKSVAVLDATIDLGTKLSTTLVGVGAALLIGLKQGVKLSPWPKLLLLLAIICFGQSAIAAVLWSLKVANSWINECLNLITEDMMQRLFEASFGLFIAGLVFTLLMVCAAAWRTEET